VLGFAPYWTLDTWREWRMQDLSAIAYFGVTLDGNGNTIADDTWSTWQGQQLTDMVNAAHAHHVKVFVTVKCFDEGQINSMITEWDHMATAVRTATDLMRMRALDGVVVDFEGRADPQYPNLQQGMNQYVSLLHASVKAYRPDAELVVATYSGSASYNEGIYNIGALSPSVDAFFVMAYDMQFDNTPGHASATAPLQGGQFNDSAAVTQYLSQAPADKVILGVPYYGYKWNVNSPDPNAAISGDPQPATYAQMLDDFSCAQQLNRHDTDATPWATWYSPPGGDPCGSNSGSWREIYYDTAATIAAKYDLVNRANLRGTGMWALGFDKGHPELWDALHSRVKARH
jgi:spore germination protein YaaH